MLPIITLGVCVRERQRQRQTHMRDTERRKLHLYLCLKNTFKMNQRAQRIRFTPSAVQSQGCFSDIKKQFTPCCFEKVSFQMLSDTIPSSNSRR